jgi:secreted trypsin-like serine protease
LSIFFFFLTMGRYYRILPTILVCLAVSASRAAARLGDSSDAQQQQQQNIATAVAAATAAAQQQQQQQQQIQPMIVGGSPVSSGGNYRWFVQANTGGCAGVLVARDVVLTAAHCGNNFALGSKVRIGSVDRGTGGESYAVEARMIHANFGTSPDKLPHDLMLLRLSVPTATTYPILPINVNPQVPANRTNLIAAGFGLTAWNGTVSPVLRQATVTEFSCQQSYHRDLDPTLTLCAGSPRNAPQAGTCAGDSGGPLFVESGGGTQTLVGITSFGADGSCGTVPSGFVRLSGHAKWLRKNLCALSKFPPPNLCQS